MDLTNEFEVALPIDEAWAVLTDVERIAPCLPGAQLQEVEGDEYRGLVKVKVGPITASYRGAARFVELDQAAHRAVLKAEGRETRGQGNANAVITATLTSSGRGTKVVVETDLAITGKVAQFGRGVLADVSGKLLAQFVHNLESIVLDSMVASEVAERAAPAVAVAPATEGEGAAKPTRPPRKAAAKKAAPVVATGVEAPATEAPATGTGGAGPAEAPAPEAAAPESAGAAPAETPAKESAGAAPAETPAPAVRRIDSAEPEPVDLVEVAGISVMRRLAPFMTVAGILLIARIVVYSLRRRKR